LPIQKGDFVLIDFTAQVLETGEVFDTTIAEEAEKHNIKREKTAYEPMLVVVGEGWVLKSLDDALVGMEAESQKTVEIPPERGFGPRDPSKVRLMPLRRFRGYRGSLFPGARVEIDDRVGTILTVGAGRVQVDFNPPLAGKTLIYDLTVKKVLEDEGEKIKALVHRRMPTLDLEKLEMNMTEKFIEFKLPEEVYYTQGLQFAKRGLASDIQKFFPRIEVVSFVEEFKRQESEATPSEEELEQENVREDSQ